MKSQLVREFSGSMQGTLPANDSFTKADSLIWESPRLGVSVPYPDREKGADRAICRTVNGLVQVKLLNTDVLKDLPDSFDKNMLTIGLYGESAGLIGAIDFYQYKLTDNLGYFPQYWIVNRYQSNGSLGGPMFSSYANLMQNIFIRVCITRPPGGRSGGFPPLKINAICSGVLLGADPR
jgi:hypothetical protein